MDTFKQQIQQKLIANVINDKCARSEHLIFRDAWCSQERVLRFTTPFFRKLFSVAPNESGKWKTGDCVMYEVNNGIDSFVVNCVLNIPSISSASESNKKRLLDALCLNSSNALSDIVLKSWDLSDFLDEPNKLFEEFDEIIHKRIPSFEQSLMHNIPTDNQDSSVFKEGSMISVVLNKYERNLQARAACIAANGTICKVCGIDFGITYGPEFSGKIEVHHIVPISEIGEEYVVDPVNDLVPVCPNCHMALHCKKDGVYTIDELKAKICKQFNHVDGKNMACYK